MSQFKMYDESNGVEIYLDVIKQIHPLKKRLVVKQVLCNESGIITKGTIMAVTMTDIQSVTVSITAEDEKGNPAALGDVPVWVSSDTTILTVTPAADGMSAVVAAVGPLNSSAMVSVTAHGAAPDGSADSNDVITGAEAFTIVASEATQFVVNAGTPA